MTQQLHAEWKVHSALVTSVDGLGIDPDLIAYPSREFIPPADDHTIWYSLDSLPGGRDPLTLGSAGQDEYVGVFQIDVSGPVGEGVVDVLKAASVVTAFYTAGKEFIKDDVVVHIRKSEISHPRKDGVRLSVSVSIYWTTRFNRQ